VMDLCLSCKGCKSECPSNVDIGKMKAEFLQQYYDKKGIPLRTRLIAGFNQGNRLASILPGLYNFMFKNEGMARPLKKLMGFAKERSMPLLHAHTLKTWFRRWQKQKPKRPYHQKIYFFCDEFSNYNDVPQGKALIQLLDHLGYEVIIPPHLESGRTYLSKGLLRSAQKIARKNVQLLQNLVKEEQPLIGLEPSAILTFRDEYPDLLSGKEQEAAKKLAVHCYTFEEFLAQEVDRGKIKSEQFVEDARLIKLHGHCHQKSLSSLTPSKKILSLPKNYQMHLIPSGCCGMAGSFGYEKEHYDVSMKIGELVLFPTIRKLEAEVIVAAAGTSCRHQIKDGTGRMALHPAEILWEALIK
ncbi:MAG: FAD-binding oxidoreductase, partial [Bacteroidota bacterium]